MAPYHGVVRGALRAGQPIAKRKAVRSHYSHIKNHQSTYPVAKGAMRVALSAMTSTARPFSEIITKVTRAKASPMMRIRG